jgi:hypothetical protein
LKPLCWDELGPDAIITDQLELELQPVSVLLAADKTHMIVFVIHGFFLRFSVDFSALTIYK